MYLASCSQDNLLRVWRISQRKSQEEDEDDEVDESSDEDVEGLSDEDVEEGGVLPDDEIRVQETSFTLEDIGEFGFVIRLNFFFFFVSGTGYIIHCLIK